MDRNTPPATAVDREIAGVLRAIATQYDEGIYAGRRFPAQGPSIIIPMPSVDAVKAVAAELDAPIDVRIHRGDVHTVAKWTSGGVDVQIVHIQAPLEDFS